MRQFEPTVERAVLALVEGADHTLKLPSNTDAHLRKVSDVIAADPIAGQYLPDFHGLVVDTIDALETSPVKLEVTGDTGKDECFLTALDFSWAVAGMIGRRFSMQYIRRGLRSARQRRLLRMGIFIPELSGGTPNVGNALGDGLCIRGFRRARATHSGGIGVIAAGNPRGLPLSRCLCSMGC